MRLLFDQNLSRRLVRDLADLFPESVHVSRVHLDVADDRQVWEFSKTEDLTIVSKDSDFRQLAFLLGSPPKAIWLRIGDASTGRVEALLRSSATAISEFGADPESALLVIPSID